MLTKIVQGFHQSFDYYESFDGHESLKILFTRLKSHFLEHQIDIQNIIFRKIGNQIAILFHFPKYQPSLVNIFYLFSYPSQVVAAQIHPHQTYQRNLPRISLFGSDSIRFVFEQIFYCTVDSFLQPNLTVCREMYRYIQNSLTEFSGIISLAGLGDDTLNIVNYLKMPSANLLHCYDTMKISLPEDSRVIATLDLDDWVTSCQERRSNVLLITPGRKGLKPPEMSAVLGLNFDRIIYVACCPHILPIEFQPFASKYQIVSTKQFPMYGKQSDQAIDLNKYLETVQIWQKITKYVDYSIGEDCCVQYHLRRAAYSPLSWCKSMSFDLIVHLFETRFCELLIKSNWKTQKTTRKFCYIEHQPRNYWPQTEQNPELVIYQIEIAEKQKLIFPHQIRVEFSESDLENCLQKLERRIDRMYDRSIPIRLFRYESKPQQINTENLNRLFKFCDRLVIITPSPEKISVRHPQLEIWPDVYYQSHESWKRERLAEFFS